MKKKEETHTCLFIISKNDPEDTAEVLRKQCEEEHRKNPYKQFTLIDYVQKKTVYYGHGRREEKDSYEDTEQRFKEALTIMNDPSNCNEKWAIRHKYDYAWIKKTIDRDRVPGLKRFKYNTANHFIEKIKGAGFTNLPEKSSFNKYYATINGDFPYEYSGLEADQIEKERRNSIISKFEELMNG